MKDVKGRDTSVMETKLVTVCIFGHEYEISNLVQTLCSYVELGMDYLVVFLIAAQMF